MPIAVRFELLLLRKIGELELGTGERHGAGLRIADHVVDDAAYQIDLLLFLFAQLGVPGDDMAHLVRDDRGQLGIVIGERDQSARHIKLAGRQRKSVDRLRIEDGDFVMQIGLVRGRHQPLDHLLDHGLQSRVVIDAAIGRQDALMFAQHGRRHGGVGELRRRRIPRQRHGVGRRRRARRKQHRRKGDGRLAQPIARDA